MSKSGSITMTMLPGAAVTAKSAAAEAISARRKTRPPLPRISARRSGQALGLANDHPDQETGWLQVTNALGSTNIDFMEGMVSQLLNAATHGQTADAKGLNFMLAVIQGVTPRDEVEAMMAAQMSAVHMATMTFARRLAHAEDLPRREFAERAFNRLARTFAVQAEALKRYRSGGEQKVTIRHVTVHEGGQAIVGTVTP